MRVVKAPYPGWEGWENLKERIYNHIFHQRPMYPRGNRPVNRR
jgi:hypothetical protein